MVSGKPLGPGSVAWLAIIGVRGHRCRHAERHTDSNHTPRNGPRVACVGTSPPGSALIGAHPDAASAVSSSVQRHCIPGMLLSGTFPERHTGTSDVVPPLSCPRPSWVAQSTSIEEHTTLVADITVFIYIYLYIYKFIYFWLRWISVAARGLSLAVASGGYSFIAVRGLLFAVASLAEHGL